MNISIPIAPLFHLIKKFRLSAIKASSCKITERLRKSICEFQVEFTNYQFTTSRLHKNFKESVESDRERHFNLLNEFVESGLRKIFGEISSQIENYFVETHSSNINPRVGIHLVTDDNEVYNIIQLTAANKQNTPPKRIEDYTVFKIVSETGKPYKDNNIPETIIKDKSYEHGGLRLPDIRNNYKMLFQDKKIFSRFKANFINDLPVDKEWNKCAGREIYNRSMYKSHIIIPITYRRHAEKELLSSDMVKILKLHNNGRTILGFLFVDHPLTYYFDDKDPHQYNNIDINSLVIYADMLSLVLVTKLMYTNGSKTVQQFKKFTGE